MNLRIEKAKTLLKNGDIQVSEVAAKVGYGDPLAFSKVFKARTGRSPRDVWQAVEYDPRENQYRGL